MNASDQLAIDGVRVTPLARIADERGAVLRMLRSDDPHFSRFGEIYFSLVHPGAVKAWRTHSRTTANFAVPVGIPSRNTANAILRQAGLPKNF